ncbi:MAG: cupin-like domain-containing protein [Burkholderiaceae bacterium]
MTDEIPVPRPIPELAAAGLDRERFHAEVVPRAEPVVLRGVVAHWPAVAQGRAAPEAIVAYLARLDTGAQYGAVLLPPEHEGRMHYRAGVDGFNFVRDQRSVSAVLEQLARYSHFERPPSVALQCAPIPECLPGFADDNPCPLLDAGVPPRLWLGNRFVTPAHIDELDNLACVVAGRRRFTLFPPEQVANLYIGPLDFTPAGAPVSMASLHAPDFARHPRLREALANAWSAELGPGDALFIPAVWWHHVESFDVVNVLVNYWWEQPAAAMPGGRISPTKSLLHALLSMRHLPPAHRKAWGEVFAHYVFTPESDPAAHLPPSRRGVLGPLPDEAVDRMLAATGTRQPRP